MYHGIINIYKEKGFTSHDVVAVLRGILKQKKIGHTGTLDPEATGVLPLCLGKGTKVAQLLTDKDKAYRTTFVLGEETTTQDHTGEVINQMDWHHVTKVQVLSVIEQFLGVIDQIPPMYSALKVNGKKLYDLAREGKVIERKSRQVTIWDIDDVIIDLPMVTMTVKCSKGTYIRTLCRDMAEALGTCGHMTELKRIQSGQFDLSTACKLDELKVMSVDQLKEHIITVDSIFSDYTRMTIKKDYDKLLNNGNKMPKESLGEAIEPVDGQRFNVYNEESDYMGIYEWNDGHQQLVPIKFFCIRQERD